MVIERRWDSMRKSNVRFYECIQNVQELGSDEECMQSILFFDLTVDEKTLAGIQCTIKQSVGSNYEKDKALEVYTPPISINFNYEKFREAATKYYFELVGSQGTMIRIENCSNVMMTNCSYYTERVYDISD
jgi:hypothetical protein